MKRKCDSPCSLKRAPWPGGGGTKSERGSGFHALILNRNPLLIIHTSVKLFFNNNQSRSLHMTDVNGAYQMVR